MRRISLVSVVVTVGVLGIIGVFVLEMSGSARRIADSDHVSAPVFAATVPGGGKVCQPVSPPEDDVGSVRLLIGTFGRPVPTLSFDFVNGQGHPLVTGVLSAGAHEGYVLIPVPRSGDLSHTAQACLAVGGSHNVVIGGQAGPGGSELVDGKHQPGSISLVYLRPGRESWWQLLPTLDTRFGLGKASFFGDWTLPVVALLCVGIWIWSIRLILRKPT